MAINQINIETLTPDERIELIGKLWDRLDPASATPLTPELIAELTRRESEVDANPEAGCFWPDLKRELEMKLR